MLSTVAFALIAGVADCALVIGGTEAAILEGDDMGYIYLGNSGPVAVAGATDATTTKLAKEVLT